ncbi:MAG: S8 family serine peptidase [Bacillota bacterium]
MPRLLVLIAASLVLVTGFLAELKDCGESGGSQTGKIKPGLYFVDSRDTSRLQSLPGVSVDHHASGDRVLVRVTSPGSLPAGIKLRPYLVENRVAPGLKASDQDTLQLNVLVFSPDDKKEVADAVVAEGGAVLKGLDEPGTTALRVKLPSRALEKLASKESVVRVEPYVPRRFLSDRAAAVTGAAPALVPGFISPGGLSGAGQIVGVADSGLDKGSLDDLHPDLQSTPGKMPKVVLLRSWASGPLGDATGHGTHMAGIVAGTGAASGGRYHGIAPGASIYFQAITNKAGEPDLPADLVSLFRPAYSAGVRVHVDGWGGGKNSYSAAASQIDRFCYYYPDFLPVFGAGNSGPKPKTLTNEANSKNALVVGATQNPRPLFGYTDSRKVASLSSSGPTEDGRLKPDLVAPGAGVIAPSSRMASLPTGQGLYRQLEGTSMAAAVTGGAVVLLREYLQKREGLNSPQAPLLKALLINGARPLKPVQASGFGLLDLCGTLLALKEHTFSYVFDEVGLKENEREVFSVTVSDRSMPLKVTLCWADPPALPGTAPALVNDLDLVVEGPDGRRYLGNDSEQKGVADRLNNVEQVTVPEPVPGSYRITVVGAKMRGGMASGGQYTQPYALVYGQPVREDVVEGLAGTDVKLAGGESVRLPQEVTAAVNGKLIKEPEQAFHAGTDLYRVPGGKVYAVGIYDYLAPGRFLPADAGTVAVGETRQVQDGGYLLRTDSVKVRGEDTSSASVPSGVLIGLQINPGTQVAWEATADWEEKKGFLDALTDNQIRLIGGAEYWLAPGYAVSRETEQEGLDALDRVFGPPGALGNLPSGLPVRIHLDPRTHSAMYVNVQQELVSGFVQEVNGDTVLFTDGRRYHFFPGAQVSRGALREAPELLSAGEHITGVVLPGGKEMLQVQVDPGLLYGLVLFSGLGGRTLQLHDTKGNYRLLELAPEARFCNGGIDIGPTVLTPGQWVRLALDSEGRVARIDLAGELDEVTGMIQKCDHESWAVKVNGVEYRVSPGSMISKNLFPVTLGDVKRGEIATVVFWKGHQGPPVALAVNVQTKAPGPDLKVDPPVFGRALTGRTSGTHLYLYTSTGRQVPVELSPEGRFTYTLDWTKPAPIRLVAVDERAGGVSGLWVELPSGPTVFTDIAKSWAAREIQALAAEGILSGYPDGTFRPEAFINRVEFAALIARCWPGIEGDGRQAPPDTPVWAREAVQASVYRGLLPLFSDGSFRPGVLVTRAAAASAFAALRQPGMRITSHPPYRDWATIPVRSRESVALLYDWGVMRGRPDGFFRPFAPITRAEAAVVIYRLRTCGNT